MRSRKNKTRDLMTEERDHYARLDRQLLRHGPIILYFKGQVLDEASEWFCRQNYEVVTFDCREWNSPENSLTTIGQKLGFPEGYRGRSLDAFNDWLRDIARTDRQGTVLIFLHYESLASR